MTHAQHGRRDLEKTLVQDDFKVTIVTPERARVVPFGGKTLPSDL